MPNASLNASLLRADESRAAFASACAPERFLDMALSFSAGVAAFPQHGQIYEDIHTGYCEPVANPDFLA